MKSPMLLGLLACLVCTSYFGPSTVEGKQNNRYRVSGILQMFNYDGFRMDITEMFEILGSLSLGDIYRKADVFFGNAEIKGTISIELPDGQSVTILERKDYDLFSYAEPIFFTADYEDSGLLQRNFKISCDLEENDPDGGNDVVCQGTHKYKARKYEDTAMMSTNVWADDIENQLNTTSLGINPIVTVVVQLIKSAGYAKLVNIEGAKDITEVVEELIALVQDLPTLQPLEMIDRLIKTIDRLSGVYLTSMTVEKISEPVATDTYKKVSNSWKITDPKGGGYDEMYGQLYLLPKASIINIDDVLKQALEKYPDIPDLPDFVHNFIKDFELPLVQGPAIPLFEIPRSIEKQIGFSFLPERTYSFSTYYRNTQDQNYVIFANLWEDDGDGSLQFDDCLSKGNALGLDRIDFSSGNEYRLRVCDDDDDKFTTFKQDKEVEKDSDTDLVEYELIGSFDIYCNVDGGSDSYYEPYGLFSVKIGARSINKEYLVWNIGNSDMQISIGQHYVQPFKILFREVNWFLDSSSQITLNGNVMEYDSGSGDDWIGNFDGTVVNVKDLIEKRTFSFPGEDNNKVDIEMQMRKVIPSEEGGQTDYVMTGRFDIISTGDSGDTYEPYGNFAIDIGKKIENMNYQVWHEDEGAIEVTNGKAITKVFTKTFQEGADFLNADQSDSAIVLHGNVQEDDGDSGDDMIGNYDGSTFKPADLKDAQNYEFHDDGTVTVSLQIRKAADIPPMVKYRMTTTLKFVVWDDEGGSYEPIGHLYIDIGKLALNQRYRVWECSGCGMSVDDGVWKQSDQVLEFEESGDFLAPGTSNQLILRGKLWEDDDEGNPDDLITDFTDSAYAADSFTTEQTMKFTGEDSNGAHVIITIERLTSSTQHQEL